VPLPEPEMNDPEDRTPEDSEEPAPPPTRARPDWLVGAEEGVASEWSRTSGDAPERPVKLRLVRPEDVAPAVEEEGEDPGPQRLRLMGPDENVGISRPTGAGKVLPRTGARRPTAWTAASSSVPTLKRSAPAMPQPAFNRLQDGDPEDAEAAASPVITGDRPPRPAPIALAPLKESWTIVAIDALQHNAQIQIAIVVTVVAILAWTFWPRGEASVSVSRIHHHPEQYDGQMVRVHGKIGDVYPIAGGYTFYLLSGRDTMVVFTRTRTPLRDDNVSIRGTISTGYLDGMPVQALFEDGKK